VFPGLPEHADRVEREFKLREDNTNLSLCRSQQQWDSKGIEAATNDIFRFLMVRPAQRADSRKISIVGTKGLTGAALWTREDKIH